VADLTTGELAATEGVGVETIRYYERKRVLPEPRRAQSGYRQYGAHPPDGYDNRRARYVEYQPS
jgi:hypothetical protein